MSWPSWCLTAPRKSRSTRAAEAGPPDQGSGQGRPGSPQCDLRDAVLAGHSMGAGEMARYLGRYGSGRVAEGVLIAPIPPYLLQAGDNRGGLPGRLQPRNCTSAICPRPR
jgi:hypothetical protein